MNDYNIINSIPSCVWVKEIDERIDGMYYRCSSLLDFKQVKSFKLTGKILEFFDVSKLSGFEYTDYFTNKNLEKGTVIALTSQNIMEQQIDYGNVIKIPYEIHNYLERSKICAGDILLSYTGQYRRACVAPENKQLHLGPNICRLRKTRGVDTHFISTFLNSKYGQSILDREKTVSAQPTVNMSRIRDIVIPIPSPEIQKYIGDKVRKAEELREEAKRLNLFCENEIKKILNLTEPEVLYNNNAGNKSLEYSDYPIKVYIKSKDIDNRLDPKSYHPELYKTLADINKLNYKCLHLRDLLDEYSTGKSSPNYAEEGLPILMTKNIKNNNIDWECRIVDKSSVNQSDIVNKDEILITTYGGPSIGKVDILFEEVLCTYDYTILKIRFNEICNPYFMTLMLRSKIVQNQIRYIIKGTTGITFAIPNEILDIRIPLIRKEVQDEIGEVYKKSLDNIKISKGLLKQAKQDIENLIEGNFDMSKVNETN